jgi:CMP-N-acetylneuraminic acid synthetase
MTDSEDIKERAKLNSVKVIHEPDELAGDKAYIMDTFNYMHKFIDADVYILLQITCPVRTWYKINSWIEDFLSTKFKSGLSVVWRDRLHFETNGHFYIFRKEQLQETDIYDENSLLFAEKVKFDIDTQEDFDKVEEYLNGKN